MAFSGESRILLRDSSSAVHLSRASWISPKSSPGKYEISPFVACLGHTTKRRPEAATSFTQFQAILSSHHLLDVNINVFPLRRRFADIDALVPQTASSNYNQNGVSVGISDSYQWTSGALLNTAFRYTRFVSDAEGQGVADMLITPEGWGGNFFNSWSRTGNEVEFRPSFQFPAKTWHGQHELKIGADISRRNYTGSSLSRPIELLRQDGSIAEQIAFQGAGICVAQPLKRPSLSRTTGGSMVIWP